MSEIICLLYQQCRLFYSNCRKKRGSKILNMLLLLKTKQHFLFYLFGNICSQGSVKFLNLSFIFQFLCQTVNHIHEIFHFLGFLKPIWSVFAVFKIFHFIVWNRRILLNFFANFFSGDEPYPNISYKDLVSKLKSGYRMGKPNNCADSMFVLFVLLLLHFLVFCCFLSSFFFLSVSCHNTEIFTVNIICIWLT